MLGLETIVLALIAAAAWETLQEPGSSTLPLYEWWGDVVTEIEWRGWWRFARYQRTSWVCA